MKLTNLLPITVCAGLLGSMLYGAYEVNQALRSTERKARKSIELSTAFMKNDVNALYAQESIAALENALRSQQILDYTLSREEKNLTVNDKYILTNCYHQTHRLTDYLLTVQAVYLQQTRTNSPANLEK